MPNRTRFYSSENLGSPIADNSYGSIIRILDGCLINGFSEQTAVSANIDGRLLTINYDSPHQYIQYQYVEISAPHQLAIAGEYRVMNLTPGSITVELPTEVDSILEGVIKTRLRPLGWECPFSSDVANAPGGGRRAYRSANTDLEVRPYLRVVDDLDPLGRLEWTKFARVAMVEDMSDINTMIGQQVPYYPDHPNSVWEGYVDADKTYLASSQWVYASNLLYNLLGLNRVPPAGKRTWKIFGNKSFFILAIAPGESSRYILYLFGHPNDTYIPNDVNNIILSTFNRYRDDIKDNAWFERYILGMGNLNYTDYMYGWIWKNITLSTNKMRLLTTTTKTEPSGLTELVSNIDPTTNYLQFVNLVIQDASEGANIGHMRSALPIINFILNKSNADGEFFIRHGHIYTNVCIAYNNQLGSVMMDLGAL